MIKLMYPRYTICILVISLCSKGEKCAKCLRDAITKTIYTAKPHARQLGSYRHGGMSHCRSYCCSTLDISF